jgi:hypothetical protein
VQEKEENETNSFEIISYKEEMIKWTLVAEYFVLGVVSLK